MEIQIKRIDGSLPLPEYKTPGAVAFDFYVRKTTIVPAQGWAKIPSNFIVEVPKGHALIISARSSLAKHHPGLFLANAPGIIDSDYCGPNDEILISVYNFTNKEITVERADRIAQGTIIKVERGEWQEVKEMQTQDRGGFGSTGLK